MTKRAFTLAELLVVIAIMVTMLVGTFGVLVMVAQQSGADSAIPTVQAILGAARAYAADNGVDTRVQFTSQTGDDAGTRAVLEYKDPDRNRWESVIAGDFGKIAADIFVAKGMPATLPSPPASTGDSDADIANWENYQAQVLEAVKSHVGTSPSFTLQFDPRGMLTGSDTQAVALTLAQKSGDKVTGKAFYAINPNTGTRMVFE
jgi:type II secretory pathway pseudopilin PulG